MFITINTQHAAQPRTRHQAVLGSERTRLRDYVQQDVNTRWLSFIQHTTGKKELRQAATAGGQAASRARLRAPPFHGALLKKQG